MDKIDPYKFVKFTQLFGRLCSTWPPNPDTGIFVLVIINFMWILGVFCTTLSFIFIILTIVHLEDDPVIFSKLLSIMGIVGDSCLHLIIVRIQWPRFQILTSKIMSFLKTAKRTERRVCRKYIKRYIIYHVILYTTTIAALIAFALSPLFLKKRFPVDAWIPFSTEPMINRMWVYIIEYITIMQSLSSLSGDCMVVDILWYTSARLELLGMDFKKIDDAFQLRNCARKHEEIIRFVKETEYAVRLLFIKNLMTLSIIIVCGGVQLSHNRSLTITSQFFFLICVESIRLFGFSWACDDLTEMGANIAWSIYQSPSISNSFYLGKSLSIIIQRSQKTLVITMWGTRLGLSLEFFTTYTLRVMSFFMTLRAVFDRYEQNFINHQLQ